MDFALLWIRWLNFFLKSRDWMVNTIIVLRKYLQYFLKKAGCSNKIILNLKLNLKERHLWWIMMFWNLDHRNFISIFKIFEILKYHFVWKREILVVVFSKKYFLKYYYLIMLDAQKRPYTRVCWFFFLRFFVIHHLIFLNFDYLVYPYK